MRVVRISVGEPVYTGPHLVDGAFVAVETRGGLHVYDVRGDEPRRVQVVDDVVSAATAGSRLITIAANGDVTRWEPTDAGWRHGPVLQVPPSPDLDAIAVSPSGRFAFVDGRRCALVDLDAERVLIELDASYGTARPCFDRLPDGREVLLVAAPGYMSVQMIDVASGAVLAAYEERSSDDFCHVDFKLTRDGTRLVTFGCVWAWPYEVIIYDATPWTASASPADGFPLPIIRRIEPTASNGLLAAHIAEDGSVMSACCDAQSLIVRRIDPRDGRTLSEAAHPVRLLEEQHIHYASGHLVVVCGPRLLSCRADTDHVDDFGELSVPPGSRSAVTRDGATAIVVVP